MHHSCIPPRVESITGMDFYLFLPDSVCVFMFNRRYFLKTQPNCKKCYNFLIKKGGFPLTALL